MDGARIEPIYKVRIVDDDKPPFEFCCIRCAELWISRQRQRPWRIFVTDETTGDEIPAARAYYVRSMVITMPATGNRIHAFRRREDAEAHARTFRGTILTDAARPFVQDGKSASQR